jgi:hypothetical protein
MVVRVDKRILRGMKVIFIIAGLQAYRISFKFVMIWAPQIIMLSRISGGINSPL